MLLRNGEDFLELTVTERGSGPERPGDTEFAVRVRVSSMDNLFVGQTRCWIDVERLAAFAQELRLLEERRQGSAAVESMSSEELRLEICSTDRAGHMAARGSAGHWCFLGGSKPHWCAVSFYVPFCPSELPALVREFQALGKL